MKKSAYACVVLACALLVQTADAQVGAIRTYPQKTLFKNWALSRCISLAYGTGESERDADIAAGAYLEFGDAPIEAYEKADALVRKFLALKYDGSVESSYNTMKCIDLYHGRDLEKLALRYSGKAK